MEKKSLILFVFLSLIYIPFCFSQEPFSQKIDCTKYKISDTSYKTLIKQLEELKIPGKTSVGVPAYPNAKIIQLQAGSKDCYNCIHLLAADDCEEIITFYKTNLKNWFNGDFKDCYQFWQGTRWEAMRRKAPNIAILPVNEKCKQCFPDMKTEIRIWFASK